MPDPRGLEAITVSFVSLEDWLKHIRRLLVVDHLGSDYVVAHDLDSPSWLLLSTFWGDLDRCTIMVGPLDTVFRRRGTNFYLYHSRKFSVPSLSGPPSFQFSFLSRCTGL